MKKLPYLLISILTLPYPLSAFAYSCQYITSKNIEVLTIFISLLLFILMASYSFNIKYFKTAVKNKKLFLITIAPLILSCPIFLAFYAFGLIEEMREMKEFKISYPIATGYISDSEYLEEMCGMARIKPILSSINSTFSFLLSYYLLIMIYGIYHLKKVDKDIGFRILKLCVTVIVMTMVVAYAIVIISAPTPGI